MKKSFTFLCFCLAFITILTNMPNHTNSNVVYAQDESKYISVVGRAEIEKQADYVELCFCIQNTANSYNDTQTKINETIETLENRIKEIDENAELIISSCHSNPIFSKNNSYTSVCNFIVKSKCLDCVDKILEVAGNNGITCFNGIHYILENKQEVLEEAYELARKDADAKAMNISKRAKLIDSNNFKQLRIPFSNTSEKIKIEAKVKNLYELINDNFAEKDELVEDDLKDAKDKIDEINKSNNTELEINKPDTIVEKDSNELTIINKNEKTEDVK